MKLFNKRLSRNIFKFIAIFICLYLLFLPQTQNFCRQISSLNYDTQNLYLWDFLPKMGVKPMKDTFYPYGFLYYYKSQSLGWYLLYSAVTPLLLTLIYFCLIKSLFKPWYLKLAIFISIILIVSNILPPLAFARYGLVITLNLLAVRLLFFKPSSLWQPFSIGLIAGLVALPFTTESLYLFLLQCLIIAAYQFTRPKKLWHNLENTLKYFFLYLCGVFIGLIPLVAYLQTNQITQDLLRFYRDLAYFSEIGVLPYRVNNFHEVFILSVILIGVISVLLRVYHSSTRPSYPTMVLTTTLISLIFYQQKNLIRDFGQTVTFYAIIVCVCLFSLLIQSLNQLTQYRSRSFLVLYLIFFICLTNSFKFPLSLTIFNYALKAYQPLSLTETLNLNNKLCTEADAGLKNLNLPESFFTVKDKIYQDVVSPKIFSFPYDPLFYLLFNQKPPMYPNIYEAAPAANQTVNLNYLKDVTHVIYNPDNTADSTPDSVRTFTQLKYILDNFTPVAYHHPYYILKRSQTPNPFFSKQNSQKFPLLTHRFKKVNWANLPNMFGRQYSSDLKQTASRIEYFPNLSGLNDFLKTYPASISGTFLITNFQNTSSPSAVFKVGNDADPLATMTFNLRGYHDYVIPLSRLPALLNENEISRVSIEPAPKDLWLVTNPKYSYIW